MKINLQTWFTERRLDILPEHFVVTTTPLDEKKHLWILENCTGRYYIGSKSNESNADWLSLFAEEFVFFEDPQEAVLYELTWS